MIQSKTYWVSNNFYIELKQPAFREIPFKDLSFIWSHIYQKKLFMKTSIKLKFRPSANIEKEGTLYFQLIHERRVKCIKTHYKIKADEWDDVREYIIPPLANSLRKLHVEAIIRSIKWDIYRLGKIIQDFDDKELPYSLTQVADAYLQLSHVYSLFSFMEEIIYKYQQYGQVRTAETYISTLNSLKRFRKNRDLLLEEINTDLLLSYEYYLRIKGVAPNTVCFYMHRLRAVYNRAVEQELIEQHYPFRKVRLSVEKTIKRAISVKYLRKLKSLDLRDAPSIAFARDIFLFSFYTRGMSFIDIAYLQKKDLQNNILTYRRKKTGQKLQIHWELCMQQILNQYSADRNSKYLLSIIEDSQKDHRRQYQNALVRINRNLKKIGKEIGLDVPLTMYVARHSWATTARDEGVPLAVISEGMGHDNEKTTQIYLASLETSVVDKANRKILRLI